MSKQGWEVGKRNRVLDISYLLLFSLEYTAEPSAKKRPEEFNCSIRFSSIFTGENIVIYNGKRSPIYFGEGQMF